MVTRILVAAVVLGTAAANASAQTKIEKVPIQNVAMDGSTMFQSYCAPCHGKDGKGSGPAAKALVKAPADLTRISARNKGTFPDALVGRYIQGLDEVPAHGSRDMPMWGDLFRSLSHDDAQALLRVSKLVDYLKSIQVK